ncbi:hypothetical protein DPMN_123170 [Dreissena polymorpha]|uniref:Uncharacterized protein n=1 Tax=Dreissena polymorpha TaxID=45954 RepID=A0A9D4JR96_DREPO|nr:hypothetical protein DPMN_123170 [Dreissena polymorpha]
MTANKQETLWVLRRHLVIEIRTKLPLSHTRVPEPRLALTPVPTALKTHDVARQFSSDGQDEPRTRGRLRLLSQINVGGSSFYGYT